MTMDQQAQIGFKTNKKGKKLAFLWDRSRVIWVRISADEAEALLEAGGVEVRYHHFGPNA